MTTRHVRAHTRDGKRVRSYTQGGPTGKQRIAAAGTGAGVAGLGLITEVFQLGTVVLQIAAAALVVIPGAFLGIQQAKKRPRRKKRRVRKAARRLKFWGPRRVKKITRRPAKGRGTFVGGAASSGSQRPPRRAPWAGRSPFGGRPPWADSRSGIWRSEGGQWRQVGGSGTRAAKPAATRKATPSKLRQTGPGQ